MNKILSILTLFLTFSIQAQYLNDWIDYDQKYYQFKIFQDGIYKIDYATMAAAGVPVGTVDPQDFQVFGFAKEQAILVEDGGDGSFDAGDYIVFHAQKNTTWLDSSLYDLSSDVLNKYYPLYNDTITYYLSWNSSGGNKRIIEESDVSFTSYTPQSYFLKTNFKEYHDLYLNGYIENGMSNATYVEGEGWSSNRFSASASPNYKDEFIPTPNFYSGAGAPNPKVTAVICGASNASYVVGLGGNHHVQVQYSSLHTIAVDSIYAGYQANKFQFQIPVAAMSGTSTKIRYQLVNDLGVASDYQSVPYTEIEYAHTPNMEGLSYLEGRIPFNFSEFKSRYDFTNFLAPNPWLLALDGGTIRKCPVVETSGTFQTIIPNPSTLNGQRFILFDESQIQNISAIQAVNGTGNFTNYTAYNYEDAYIIITHKDLWTSATNYALYRSSPAGGLHNVILLDVEELYHQFGGGVEKHVIGLRNLAHFAYNSTSIKPNHIFIIGKGVREASESIATGGGTRKSTLAYNMCLIPAFGYPANDNLITAKLEGNLWDPLIPIGRLAANSNEQVNLYLDKVIEFEGEQDPSDIYTIENKLWQKQVLHFGGGATAPEQSQFKIYLSNYEGYLEGAEFGGNITGFYKTVSDPIDPVTLYEVNEYINNGASIMTFFGHASADGFDQNVDDPANWNNEGKYPLVVGNACLTGNIFEPNTLSTSEEFVMIDNKGAIAFLANVKQAYSSSLNQYSDQLFRQISQLNYGATIGNQVKATIGAIQDDDMYFGLRNVCNQMTLHGDPALRINPHEKPELAINNSSLFIEPGVIDLTVDSIDVNIVLYNLGRATNDTFGIELTRTFPDGNGDSTYYKEVFGAYYIDTITFTIPFYNNIGVGLNTFNIRVDQPSIIPEQYDEIGNNILTRQVLFDVDGIYPVWPYDYAVVPKDTLTLKGSTVNPFADVATYRFELDTTDLYNSPEHRFALVTSAGGVVEVDYNDWLNFNTGAANPLILQDSMVYFWRTTLTGGDSLLWIENSFQYIPGKQGWGQDHFFQFKNNEHRFLEYNRDIRRRLFGEAYKTIECDVYGNANSWLEFAFTMWRIDGEIAEYNFCSTNPQLFVCVVDPFTLEPWGTYYDNGTTIENPTHNFGNANNDGACRPRVEYHFGFYQDNPTQMAAMQYMIENEIPDSFYVLIYTSRYANYSEWDAGYPAMYDVFNGLGSDSIVAGKPEVPFILFTKMGDPSSTKEIYGSYLDELIQFQDTLWGYDYNGIERSTLIGPAQEWDALYWKQFAMESPTYDSTRLKVFGITAMGVEEELFHEVFTTHDSIINLSSLIDANDYPYLRLESDCWDTIGYTPAQVDGWHVLYTPVPEAALDGSAGIYFMPEDTLQEGQQIEVAFDIKNISDLPMDSLLVHYWVEDANHNLIYLDYPRQDSLRVGQTIRDTLLLPSLSYGGYNSLWVEVNPYITGSITDQPEQYHFNNLGQLPFYITVDNENPLLDVTFNGQHLLNGDIIDPYSEMVITLKDENPFLLLNEESDTANFGIYLTYPNGNQRRLNFKNSSGETLMEWIPAGADNKFQIIKNFNLTDNGTYRLLVQGVDKSGNLSGDLEYEIEFEVDRNPSITHLMNYPNPLSTSTQFVFTLTGSQVPDEFTIQIMTISGKVVREITVDELGPIHIGRNITEYTWDGRDEYGDILANGVYLYRVITKINGETLEHRSSDADQYFTNEFGKMYIIR